MRFLVKKSIKLLVEKETIMLTMKIHEGLDCLILTSKKEKVMIAPDRENHNAWFVDYTEDHGQVPYKRVTLTSKELRYAFGVSDRRVKHIMNPAPGKYSRYGNFVNVPDKEGIMILTGIANPAITSAVKKLTAPHRTQV